ncbi:DUF6039 family protein, partial [Saccharothrix sp. MB29]|nr:DUF6039 family protein [Saccharothrix sp. MB29]
MGHIWFPRLQGTWCRGGLEEECVTIAEPLTGGQLPAASPARGAQGQTALAPGSVLHTANAGMIVERTAQVRNEFHSEARV